MSISPLMSDCNSVSDEGVFYLSRNLLNLTKLDVGNNKIGNQSLISIARNLKNLVQLLIGKLTLI
jgi:hypothetical protein